MGQGRRKGEQLKIPAIFSFPPENIVAVRWAVKSESWLFKVLIQVDLLTPAADQAEKNSALLCSRIQSQLILDQEEKLNTFPGKQQSHVATDSTWEWDYAKFGTKSSKSSLINQASPQTNMGRCSQSHKYHVMVLLVSTWKQIPGVQQSLHWEIIEIHKSPVGPPSRPQATERTILS